MKIERIAKKDEKTIVIYLDQGNPLFLSYEIFLKNGLRKNDELSEDRFLLLIDENRKYHLKQKAFNFLGRRLHTSYELKIKLRQKGYEKEMIDSVLTELEENKLINDKDFAYQFADEKIRIKLWGKSKIAAELAKKGVSREIVSEVLYEKFPQGNDLDSAIELAEKKTAAFSFKKLPKEKQKARLFSFLSSRGYDFDTIKQVVALLILDDKK